MPAPDLGIIIPPTKIIGFPSSVILKSFGLEFQTVILVSLVVVVPEKGILDKF